MSFMNVRETVMLRPIAHTSFRVFPRPILMSGCSANYYDTFCAADGLPTLQVFGKRTDKNGLLDPSATPLRRTPTRNIRI